MALWEGLWRHCGWQPVSTVQHAAWVGVGAAALVGPVALKIAYQGFQRLQKTPHTANTPAPSACS